MGRWLRFLVTFLGARRRPAMEVRDISLLKFRVWPTECDAAWLNHAALLVLMECGRVDLMVRFGFLGLARASHWYLPLATMSVRFHRPARRFERLELRSRIVDWDDEAIWIEHQVTRGGKPVAAALAKNLVRKGREPVKPEEILRALGKELPPRPAQRLWARPKLPRREPVRVPVTSARPRDLTVAA
jgi:acyl-CoA thioesterase FadM